MFYKVKKSHFDSLEIVFDKTLNLAAVLGLSFILHDLPQQLELALL